MANVSLWTDLHLNERRQIIFRITQYYVTVVNPKSIQIIDGRKIIENLKSKRVVK